MLRIHRAARLLALVLIACFALSGCLSVNMYVDKGQPTLTRNDFQTPAHPKPAQLLFEFRQKGAANARATTEVRPIVTTVATESGLFSTVSQTPVDGGGVLTVKIDNVPLTDDAAAKGFGTGLTFGMVGSIVTDGYVCSATYTVDGKSTQVDLKHAIYTTIGNHAGPPGLTAMAPKDAVNLAMSQIMWNLLKQLSDKHAFE
jgi:hypothetical protein